MTTVHYTMAVITNYEYNFNDKDVEDYNNQHDEGMQIDINNLSRKDVYLIHEFLVENGMNPQDHSEVDATLNLYALVDDKTIELN